MGAFANRDQKNIRAKPGEDVTLPCGATENKTVIVIVWSRTDLRSNYVLLYRDKQYDPENQFPSFKNRVDLKDVDHGDVSLNLQNVTINDTGTYECRVIHREDHYEKRAILSTDTITIIDLRIEPDQTNAWLCSTRNTDIQRKDGGKSDAWKNGLIVGGFFAVVLVLVLVAVFVHHRRQRCLRQDANPLPETELERITA